MAKIINILPKNLVKFVSKKVVKKYLNNHANIVIDGEEKLETIQTPTIFVCNHLSNSDGLVLSKVLTKVDPTFVAGVKLSENAVTSIGMNVVKTINIKPNTPDKEGIKNAIRLVKKGGSLLIFPEGTRSREGSLIKAKKGILFIARKAGVPIVPICIYGSEKLMPINQEGDMSGESFYDADVYVNIGDQFQLPEKKDDQNKKEYSEAAINMIMYKIAELLPEEYRGVYK